MSDDSASRQRLRLQILPAADTDASPPSLDWLVTQAHATVVLLAVDRLAQIARTQGFPLLQTKIHDLRTEADRELLRLGGSGRLEPDTALFHGRMPVDGPVELFEAHIRRMPGRPGTPALFDGIWRSSNARALWKAAIITRMAQLDDRLDLAAGIREGVGNPEITEHLTAMKASFGHVERGRPDFSILDILDAAAPTEVGGVHPARREIVMGLVKEVALPKLEKTMSGVEVG